MTVHWKRIVLLIVGVCILLVAVLTWIGVRVVGQRGVQTYEGYFAPVYSPDGQYVYFVERRTSGTARQTSKPSIMLDAPPKFDVSVASDMFSLKRLHVQSGKIEELVTLPPSPLEGRSYESIGNLFQLPDAGIKFTSGGQLEFIVSLKTLNIPTEKEYSSAGVWTEGQHAAQISWEETHRSMVGYNEWPLFGDWELLQVRGDPDYGPIAIVAYNHVTGDTKALVKNKRYDHLYPNGLPLRLIQENSRRQEIERRQALTRTRAELQQKYKAMGMGEIEMYYRITKDMQRLGYYPKTPTIVARRLSREEAAKIDKDALFSIAKDEMESGTLPDIEKAIASPGEEIDHDSDGYYIHRDYTTSARLNAFLKAGKTQFYVRYLGNTYEMTIKNP